jgi:hypothetical protein
VLDAEGARLFLDTDAAEFLADKALADPGRLA